MATTAHSPNRKERPPRDPAKRWKSRNNALAIEAKKERIINGVAIGKTRGKAAIDAGMSPGGLQKILSTHPGFRTKVEAAEAEWAEQVMLAKGEIASRLVRIAQRVGDTVLTTEDEKIIISGGLPIMRGAGVLVEKGASEEKGKETNPERILIVNIIGNPEARQAAITLARAIELQEAQGHENT